MMKSARLPEPKRAQKGVAAVEFAFVAAFLIIGLFAIIEFGRLFFTINSVQEITRRAAREQVVRWIDSGSMETVRRKAVLRAGSTGVAHFPGSPDITHAHVRLSFLRLDLTEIPQGSLPESSADNIQRYLDGDNNCIRFVRARLAADDTENAPRVPFEFIALFGFGSPNVPFGMTRVDQDYLLPYSTVLMPAEALGLL